MSSNRKCPDGKQKIKTLHSIYSLMSFTDDECRIIIFKEPIENKTMRGHVIKSGEVDSQGSCRVMCYMDPNCVSINFGPSQSGKYRCELNNATDEDHLTILDEKPAYTFLAIEVNIFLAQLFLLVQLCLVIVALFDVTATTATTI